jgi:hypothetical protein
MPGARRFGAPERSAWSGALGSSIGSDRTWKVTARVLDLVNLTWGRELPVRYGSDSISLDPEATRLIVTSRSNIVPFGAVQLVDLVSGASIVEYPLCSSGLGVAYVPSAPTGLRATVTGTSVRLDWSVPAESPLATAFVVEVGSNPGGVDLASFTVSAPTLMAERVPPGRYYVRVRAANHTGVGAASPEIVVDAP